MSDPKSNILMAPGDTAGLRTEALARPNGVREDGTQVRPHPFMGTTILQELRHFICSEVTAVMHRPDGKKLAFMFGHLATNIKQDIEYLENEIAEGHPFLSRATDAQIQQYNMKTDPRGTIARELRPQIEADVRAELEAKIRAELLGEKHTDEQKIAGTAGNGADNPEVVKTATATVRLGGKLPDLTGSMSIAERIAAMKIAAQRPPINPVSTANIAGAAAGSGGQF